MLALPCLLVTSPVRRRLAAPALPCHLVPLPCPCPRPLTLPGAQLHATWAVKSKKLDTR